MVGQITRKDGYLYGPWVRPRNLAANSMGSIHEDETARHTECAGRWSAAACIYLLSRRFWRRCTATIGLSTAPSSSSSVMARSTRRKYAQCSRSRPKPRPWHRYRLDSSGLTGSWLPVARPQWASSAGTRPYQLRPAAVLHCGAPLSWSAVSGGCGDAD